MLLNLSSKLLSVDLESIFEQKNITVVMSIDCIYFALNSVESLKCFLFLLKCFWKIMMDLNVWWMTLSRCCMPEHLSKRVLISLWACLWLSQGKQIYTLGLPRITTKSEPILNINWVVLIRHLYYLNMENASNCFRMLFYWKSCYFSLGFRVLSLN